MFKFKRKRSTQTSSTKELLKRNLFITNIELCEFRPFYDSTWLVSTLDGDVKIIRADDESITAMCQLLASANSIAEVKQLDMRKKIFYD